MKIKGVTIIDDFLPKDHFNEINRLILGTNSTERAGNFPMFYAGGSVPDIAKDTFAVLYEKYKLDYSKPCPHLSHVFFLR